MSALADGVRTALLGGRVLVRTGMLAPRRAVAAARASRTWGKGLGGAVAANAMVDSAGIAVIDDHGSLTHGELHDRSGRLACELVARGIRPDATVGLLARDHRWFVEALAAVAKTGADVVLLSTAAAAPQLADVIAREGVALVIADEELAALLPAATPTVLARCDTSGTEDSIDAIVAAQPAGAQPDPPPDGPGRVILLTSGTTGTPKGARRPKETPTAAILAVLDRIPMRTGTMHFVPAPLYHAWGFAWLGLGMLLGCTVVVRSKFDPEQTLAAIAKHRVRSVALVPVMGLRMLALPEETVAKYDLSSWEIASFGGSAMPGDMAVAFMDRFGDIAYNGYGSTEVAIVSIATPADLRADHASAGLPVASIDIRLLDSSGNEVPRGEVGTIYVRSEAAFEGYTGGGSKDVRDGYMSTGDIGRFDAHGRLSIEGRDDDMIVSGGENVYPREVEDLIAAMDGIDEAVVVGVPDEEFGQRLRAVVVGAGVDADQIRGEVRSHLARYKVPRDVIFVDELPRNATGKVLRRALVELERGS